ncbi:hypothetical protein AMS68_002145 [Peltaster fructicola]|uniref:Wax synthase domain-containing protein n=1 Tax=Peltaster fructicola TaxID=286661 RepID=A0A6H0XPR8_9PEZI|nr:hypothetical protein AMS68_002145 [Peltaster fructicola]
MVLSITPFLVKQNHLIKFLNGAALLVLCLLLPCYTFGDASSDYYNSGPVFAMLLWYIDFVLCTPREGDGAPAFQGKRWEALTIYQRLAWAFRLMLPTQRGIGWNWQIKDVPPGHSNAWQHAQWAIFYYAQSVVMLIILGASLEGQGLLANAIVGWSGAIWVWDRLNCAYSVVAALTIALRICEPWEWPPLMGSLKDAWTVRRMWSAVYHQSMRRMLSQPALRLTRLLGIRKGSTFSGSAQLFISFGISCFFHQYQMFTTRHSVMHEFSFFMLQPLAITLEDAVLKWTGGAGPRSHAIGYAWIVLWFSISLPIYITDLTATGIVTDWVFGAQPLELGVHIVTRWR